MGKPVVFAVAIIAIVYLPIFSLTGVEGKMFKPMSLTIVFALAGSLLLSLTYVPAMMSLIYRKNIEEKESIVLKVARPLYERALNLALLYRLQVISVALAMLVLSAITFPLLGAEFIPRLDEGSLAAQIQQLPSVSLTQSIKTASDTEKTLLTFPEVTKVVSKIGRAEVCTEDLSPF